MWSTDMAGSHRVFGASTLPLRLTGKGRLEAGSRSAGEDCFFDAPSGYIIRSAPAWPAPMPPTLLPPHVGERGRKWGLLLPGAPEPRLTLLRRQDFRSV